jgi:hypothetical protein
VRCPSDSNELAFELTGDSSLHLMIFRDTDPKEKRRRKDEEDRRRALRKSYKYTSMF